MKRTLAYNRYPLVICALGLLLGGLHSLFQLHQTPADTWTAAYLTAREGTELMLTENSTDPQVLRSLLHLLIGVPLLGGLFSRGYAVKGIFAATRRGRYLHFYRAEMGRLLTVTLLYNLLYCGAQALCATVAVHALPAAAAVRLIGISLFSDTLVLFGFAVLCAGLCVTRGEKAGILLGAAAFLLAVVIGVAAGVIAALKQNTRWDYAVMGVAMTGVVIPSFVVAPLLVMIFAITLHWLPGGGWNGGALKFMILPMVALSLAYIASIARITRGSMIEVLHSNFIRTARAKGLPMRRIILRHALKPALLPVLSYMGPAFVGIITGSMVIETIYGLPGIGQLFVNGALNRDYSLVLSLTILVGALTILFNAIVDVLYAVIDPKIRY